jgi:type I restriction enzyme M protein
LAVSKKKHAKAREKEEAEGRAEQEAIRALVEALPSALYKDRAEFVALLDVAAKSAGLKLAAPIRKAILAALSERDETAAICLDGDGNPEPDPELRNTENVPLAENIDVFFAREVAPHVPDAWINRAIRDHKDGEVGKVGYEINFNRYFYRYVPPRKLEAIQADIQAIEKEIVALLREVAG